MKITIAWLKVPFPILQLYWGLGSFQRAGVRRELALCLSSTSSGTLFKWRPTAYYSCYPPRSIHVLFLLWFSDGRPFDLSMTWSVGYSIATDPMRFELTESSCACAHPFAHLWWTRSQGSRCSRNEKEEKVEDVDGNLKLPVEAYSRVAMPFSDAADYHPTIHWRNVLEMSLKSAILSSLSEFFTTVLSALSAGLRIIMIKKQ